MEINEKLLYKNLKQYYLSKLKKREIINYVLNNLKNQEEYDIIDLIKVAADELNIKLTHKYKNVSTIELILNRISIYLMVIIIIVGISNSYLQFIDPLLIIAVGILNLIIFTLVDRSYFVSIMLFFILLILLIPLVLDLNNKILVVIFALAVIITFIYCIFIYNRKRLNIDNQNHLYKYSEYDNVDNYFSQKFGEKYISVDRVLCSKVKCGDVYFNNSWGKMTIDLRDVNMNNINIHIVNQYGQIDLIIDKNINYNIDIKSKLGDVFYKPQPNNSSTNLNVKGVNNFGVVFFVSE